MKELLDLSAPGEGITVVKSFIRHFQVIKYFEIPAFKNLKVINNTNMATNQLGFNLDYTNIVTSTQRVDVQQSENTLSENQVPLEISSDVQKLTMLNLATLKHENTLSQPSHRHPEHDNDDQNSGPKQIYGDGIPSWKEMELIRKANKLGMKREKTTEYKCEICDRIFAKKEYLKNHWVIHTNEKPFKCPKCDVAFTKTSSVARHIKTHHSNERKHVCKICKKAYALPYSLLSHMKTHRDKVAQKCPECDKSFTLKGHLARHLKLHKKARKPKEYKCGKCEQSFIAKDELKIHVKENHSAEGEEHFCEDCGKSFAKASHFNVHIKSHSGEKLFMCEMCGQCFSLKSHLQRHLNRVHPECVSTQTDKDNVIDADEDMILDAYGHFKSRLSASVENDFIMYTCSRCGKCFIQEEHLREHTKLLNHTGSILVYEN